MKFIVSSGTLLRELQAIGGVINNNNTLPILDNFLFELSPNQLKVSASDLETTMSTTLAVETESEGTAGVPAKILLDTLKTFPEQPLTFTLDEKSHNVEVSSDFGKYSLAFVEGDEFPQLPELEDASEAVVPGDVLGNAIAKTIFAAGNDDLRPVMSGVFFQFASDSLTFVATDAHKLVRYRRTDLSTSSTAEFIMPRKPLNLLRSSLVGTDGDVKIFYNETNARFEYDNIIMTCRLIDGKYPNYEAVIPKDNPNRMLIDRSGFLSSVKRVSIFSNKTTHQIRLKIAGTELTVSAEDLDFSNKAVERLTCDYDGSDMEIGFNSRFLTEMLNNLESDSVKVELSAPNRAGLLIPNDGVDEGEDLLMLVMPVMLNS
ncbi:MAG: DNA polymerase III subunit beta [Flavobacteriia bacterium]|nr:DNA polymerase III subunit beta [Flavobacteriia bacterium]